MTYKDLSVGQKFRLVNWPKTEWTKTEPTITNEYRYNALGDDGRHQSIGHSAKVMVHPYTSASVSSAAKQRKRYSDYAERVRLAGWKSPAEFETAIISGVITVPSKPE